MTRVLPLTATLALLATGPAFAQTTPETAQVVPGQEFMLQWDLDSDGKVTLDEARTHRADLFAMFDSDGNGQFTPDELKGIDEFKAAQLEAGMGPGHQRPEGMQPGAGPGRTMGQGRGMMGQGGGQGGGMGGGMGGGQGAGFFASAEDQMRRFDSNGDGAVAQAEFVAGTDQWFAMRDRTGDGAVTTEDFGPRRKF